MTRTGYVSVDDMQMMLPQLDLDSLPNLSDLGLTGADGEQVNVAAVQQLLIDLGYLDGEADGAFGPASSGALSSFQADSGLVPTGEMEDDTLLALLGTADGTFQETLELNYPAILTPEEKFASISDSVSQNLDAFTDPSWRFSYDKFEKTGKLDPGIETGSTSIQSPDMDRIQIDTSLKVMIAADDKGALKLIPALVVESYGAYRPFVKSVIFSQGNTVTENTGAVSIGGLDGAMVQEMSYVPLTEEALDLISNSPDLDLRIVGKNKNYDLHFGADADQLSAFAEAAKGTFEADS